MKRDRNLSCMRSLYATSALTIVVLGGQPAWAQVAADGSAALAVEGGAATPAASTGDEVGKQTTAATAGSQDGIEEIVVTATKRNESIQRVPVSVQALDTKALSNLNITSFDDYVKYLPSVRSGGRGPGQNDVYIRGQATDAVTVLLSGAQGSEPNVAMYLDEQPVTSPGRNLDVYVTDMARIEVLPGPQGSLFGASSMAGTVRLITNKPDMSGLSASVTGTAEFTKSGDMSNAVEGFVNVPLADNLAVRGVFYSAHRGGYIDNVPGTYTPSPAVNSALPSAPGTTYETANNSNLVQKNFNDASYRGVRLSAAYKVSSDLDILVTHARQVLDTDGVFDYDPKVGDLEVTRFFPDFLRDKFSQTAWTVNGRLKGLDLVYTGAFLDRKIAQAVDYTGYTNTGAFAAYYTCTYTTPRRCLDPVKGYNGNQRIRRFTQEARLSTPQDLRVRLTAGLFYDRTKLEALDDYVYEATPQLGFARNAPITAARNIDPGTRPAGVAFFNDITRIGEQKAIYGEAAFDIVPGKLILSGGGRYYWQTTEFYGSSNFANLGTDSTVPGAGGRIYNRPKLREKGFVPKATLTFKPTARLLFYATYSEGFRPGGFNRGGGAPSFNPAYPTVPVNYVSDSVKNYELGFKTDLFDRKVRFNGSFYRVDWRNIQVSRLDTVNVSNLTFIDNAANARINGFEGDLTVKLAPPLTLFSAVSYNDAKLTGTQSTVIELAPVGSQLPLTPKIQGNVRLRYDGLLEGDRSWFAQVGTQLAAHSYNSLASALRVRQDGYSTFDASGGFVVGKYRFEIYGENLTDTRAQLFYNNQDQIPRITTNRPRTIGLKVTVDM